MDQAAKPIVTAQDIEAAERVVGVSYTPAERALVAAEIAEQIGLAAARRADTMRRNRDDEDMPPATVFDPRLPGFRMPEPAPLHLPRRALPLPDDDADIAFAPITAQIGWIRAGSLTATRLTRIYLDRIAQQNPVLQCYARLNPTALDEAAALDARAAKGDWAGPLHGIPYACKDIIDTAGLATDWGAEPFEGRVPVTDAIVVRRLRDAGAIILGKSTVGALAYGDLWHGGRTRNPWNPEEGSSGSSAGSASATAAGLCGFSLGTETYGSIVSPSTRCGTVGLRPSFGRVARSGVMSLCPSLDKIGPIGRSVDDCALVMAVINGADPSDVSSIEAPFGGDLARDLATLRVGYFPADVEGEGALDQDRAILEHCRALGVHLVALTRPDLPYDSLTSILMAEAAALFEPLTLSDRDDLLTWQDADAWPNQFRMARFLSAVDHIQLDRLRRRVMIAMDALFTTVDVMIGPALAGPMLGITNFTGHPCLCLPSGFIASPSRIADTLAGTRIATDAPTHHVPHASSLWGRLFDEAPMLALGRALESRLGLALRPPARAATSP
ncbi:amidase [Acidiphilium sp. PA]|uniref:amidase n=1 Tax=Acidiphilium sp. PA TaxID=2871705 RepID=UPI00224354C7|nr:amidase [Acidiphilium sp. PA]MCW8306891.1 amidase [Acidiphilium sp. PA]